METIRLDINGNYNGYCIPYGCVANWHLSTSVSDWDLILNEKEDWYKWTESFTAIHSSLGSVSGDSHGYITLNPTDSQEALIEAFNNDIHCSLRSFDTWEN